MVRVSGAPDEVVDMKRAVPEGDMESAPTTRQSASFSQPAWSP